jgi:hypothetical protein
VVDLFKPPGTVIPFGKYRGQPVEALMADASYCEWLMAQPWFRERYASLVTIIVNGGVAPDADTPEHNRLQALFLDGEFCVAAYRSAVGDAAIDKRLRERLHKDDRRVWEAGKAACRARGAWEWTPERRLVFAEAAESTVNEIMTFGQPLASFYAEMVNRGAQFEVDGWDVVIDGQGPREFGPFEPLNIELKPQVGDDYSAILRAMKARMAGNGHRALIVDRFDAEGATYDQVKRMFTASGVEVRTLAEIRTLVR